MDLQHLRTATRQEHEATEAAMPLFEAGLTLAVYGEILCCLLPVLRSWEGWCAENAPRRLRVLLEGRQRSPWLEADLLTLNLPCRHLPSSEQPEIAAEKGAQLPISWMDVVLEPGETPQKVFPGEFEAGFLGALYVLEGSTLGGRILARQVEVALGIKAGQGNAYFQGHGAETGAKWREVTVELGNVPEALSERLIRSAKRTFQVFGRALEEQHGVGSTRPVAECEHKA